MDATDGGVALVVVADFNYAAWTDPALPAGITLTEFVNSIIAFAKTHLLMHQLNRIAIVGAFSSFSRVLFATNVTNTTAGGIGLDDNFADLMSSVTSALHESVTTYDQVKIGTSFSGALGSALSYINRLEGLPSRILTLSASADVPAQYIAVMNSIFAAQKLDVLIDALTLGVDSPFLQQACQISGGIYMKMSDSQSFLQLLLSVYLSDKPTRTTLAPPAQPDVDFRASCFCHQKPVDIALVCSVCLSIFCNFSPVCPTCKTKFPIKKAAVPRKV